MAKPNAVACKQIAARAACHPESSSAPIRLSRHSQIGYHEHALYGNDGPRSDRCSDSDVARMMGTMAHVSHEKEAWAALFRVKLGSPHLEEAMHPKCVRLSDTMRCMRTRALTLEYG